MAPTPEDIYPSNKLSFNRYASRRSVVHSTRGIVSCTQPLAARAGIRVLDMGGNAADAAIATAAALNMTEPTSTGIGGDMFCLFYDTKAKRTRALNGSGRSPADLSLKKLRDTFKIPDGHIGYIPSESINAVTIPGAAAGWVDTLEKFGSGRLRMDQILQPAIELGEQGFPVSELASLMWQSGAETLRHASPNFAEMLRSDSSSPQGYRGPKPGELMFNKNLAKTFRAVAEQGKRGFYEGRIAEAVVQISKDLGGFITLEDLKAHADKGSEEVDPISIKYHGQGIKEAVELWEHPPNGQGLVALIALGVFQELEKQGKIKRFSQDEHNSLEYLHALIEALRIAFADGTYFIADPNTNPPPIDTLLSEKHLSARAAMFNSKKSIERIEHMSPSAFSGSDTVYFSVTDSEGNAASFINSNYEGFGTGIIPKGCGFTLQNRGSNFVTGPKEHPNIYAPSKRPYHTIIPAMVTCADTGELHTCFGVMGGFMQPQGHVQVLLNMLVFGMNPQEALDAPRICIEVGNQGVSDLNTEWVFLEKGISPQVVDDLRALGHRTRMLDDFHRAKFGRGQVIRQSVDNGVRIWSAGSDLRGDGHAVPL